MKKKSSNPFIKSFEEFEASVKLGRKADGKGFGGLFVLLDDLNDTIKKNKP